MGMFHADWSLIPRRIEVPPDYAVILVAVLHDLEARLTARYDRNWRLRIERESPGVWHCRWDILTTDGEVLGGGSESFTVNV